MRLRLFLGLFLFLAPLAAPGLALAQPPPGGQPLDRLLPQIRRAYPGQFLDAEGVTTGGSPRYHLKWLTPDGRVMWLDADARTGRVTRTSPGRDSFDAPRYRAPDNDADNEAGPPDRGGEGRNRSYDGSRFGGQRSYPDGGDAAPQRGRFGNGGPGDRGPGERVQGRRMESGRGGGNRSSGGARPRGRSGNRR